MFFVILLKIIKEGSNNMSENKLTKEQMKALAKKQTEETLASLKQFDKNVWTMVYKNNYGLDKLLEKGCGSIMDAVIFLQKEVNLPALEQNPEHSGFACSTFNAKTPEGQYILGRNFDYKQAPCLVCWTAPEKGYRSVAVVDTTFFIHGTKYHTLEKSKKKYHTMGAPYMAMDGINVIILTEM